MEPSTRLRRDQPPISASAGAVSRVFGTKGQKARRPNNVSSAGRKVSIASAAQATPMEPMGPIPAVPSTFAMERHNSAAITVAAEANTAGPAEIMAFRIASYLSFVWCSSSR